MRIRYGISQVGYAANFIEYAGGTPNPSPTPAPVVQKPDLTGAFTKLNTDPYGHTLSGSFLVENMGNAATANSFRVLLYLSKDGVSQTTLLGSATVSVAIPPDYYVNLGINVYNSSSTYFKGKYAIAVIDPDDSVPDSNRANNVVVSNTIQKK